VPDASSSCTWVALYHPKGDAQAVPKKRGRPRLTPEQREAKRLEKCERERERRRAKRAAKEAVKAQLAKAAAVREGTRAGNQSGTQAAVPSVPDWRRQPRESAPFPAFTPTSEDRVRVLTLAGFGLRHDEIALQVVNPRTNAPIDESTLRKHFELELGMGPSQANGKVAESLFAMATGRNGARRVPSAAIFWAKARMGWRETQHVEVDLRAGVLVAPAEIGPAEWVEAAQRADEGRREPGASGNGNGNPKLAEPG